MSTQPISSRCNEITHSGLLSCKSPHSIETINPEQREYPQRLVELVLRLRARYSRCPGETDKLILADLERRHIRGITEDDIDEIVDRRIDALEGELACVDSCAEWSRQERRRIERERMRALRMDDEVA